MSTLISNATVLTASQQYPADIRIDAGLVTAIGQALPRDLDTAVIDATGKLVMPGGIDVHTHLDMPYGDTSNGDDFFTGTVAAAHGGTTTIVDYATQSPGGSLRQALDEWRARADAKAVIDYGFHMCVCDMASGVPGEMARLTAEEGVTSFKLFMAYRGRLMLDDGSIFRVMQTAGECGGLICMHAENGDVIDALVAQARARGDLAPRFHALTRPARCEGEATGRALDLAAIAGAPIYIVHVTCREAVGRIARARRRGQAAFGETCPQYLFLTAEEYERPGFEGAKFVMSPPLRGTRDQDALWDAARADVLQTVGTDHCPFGYDQPPLKQRGRDDFSRIPNGAPGIEDRLMLLWDGGVRTGRITPHRFVELVSTNPARLFGLWPRKGDIVVGADADLVVWDPEKRVTLSAATHHMRVDYNLYEGRAVTGAPSMVLSRGEVIVRDGEFLGRPGRGEYLKRRPFGRG
jgi:dihydropyrimidinase